MVATAFLVRAGAACSAIRRTWARGRRCAAACSRPQGRWVLITDADLSTPIEEHAKLAEIARDDDLDVAIRLARSSRFPDRNPPEPAAPVDGQDLQPHPDTADHAPAAPRHAVRLQTCSIASAHGRLFERMVVDHFAFDVELLFLCDRFGCASKEVPVVWRNSDRLYGQRVHRSAAHAAGSGAGPLAFPSGPVQPVSARRCRRACGTPLLDAPVLPGTGATRAPGRSAGCRSSGLVAGARALLTCLLASRAARAGDAGPAGRRRSRRLPPGPVGRPPA